MLEERLEYSATLSRLADCEVEWFERCCAEGYFQSVGVVLGVIFCGGLCGLGFCVCARRSVRGGAGVVGGAVKSVVWTGGAMAVLLEVFECLLVACV